MKAACAELAELRSAFVDGALDAADYDRVSEHLAGCDSCRRDVEDLRIVHDLVRRNGSAGASPPPELAQRLVAIADSHPDWSGGRGSIRRTRGKLSPRRRIRLRTAVATLTVAMTIAAVGAIGYVNAPADLVAVSDPADEAEVEFSSARGQFPLNSDSLSTAVRVDLTDPTAARRAAAPAMATGKALSPAAVEGQLRRAAAAGNSVDYVGEQSFVAYAPDRTYTARVQVVSQSGQASQINLISQNGEALASDSAQAASSSRMADTEVLALLEQNYDLSGARGATVAGRPALMLQAVRNGTVAGRWWVDQESGLVLWQQRFDGAGRLQVSTGFTSLALTQRPDLINHLPPRVMLATTNVTLTLATVDPLTAAGWAGPRELAGLSLMKLRADRAVDPQAVHLVYSDGLHTVSVYQQRGRLLAGPAGSSWDEASQAYVQHGTANVASWQSGETVITVLTDGSPQLLTRTVALLPHTAASSRTTMGRVQAGWVRILAIGKG